MLTMSNKSRPLLSSGYFFCFSVMTFLASPLHGVVKALRGSEYLSHSSSSDARHLLPTLNGNDISPTDIAFGGDGLQRCFDVSAEKFILDDTINSFEPTERCLGQEDSWNCTTRVPSELGRQYKRSCEKLDGFLQRFVRLVVKCQSYHDDEPGKITIRTKFSLFGIPHCFYIDTCHEIIADGLCERYANRYVSVWEERLIKNNHHDVNCAISKNDCLVDYELDEEPPMANDDEPPMANDDETPSTNDDKPPSTNEGGTAAANTIIMILGIIALPLFLCSGDFILRNVMEDDIRTNRR